MRVKIMFSDEMANNVALGTYVLFPRDKNNKIIDPKTAKSLITPKGEIENFSLIYDGKWVISMLECRYLLVPSDVEVIEHDTMSKILKDAWLDTTDYASKFGINCIHNDVKIHLINRTQKVMKREMSASNE